MKAVSPDELRQRLGDVLEATRGQPVAIREGQRDMAVLISKQEYDRLKGDRVAAFRKVCDTLAADARARGLTEDVAAELLPDYA